MNLKTLAGLGAVAVLGAGGVILGLGGLKGDVAEVTELRAARLDACPVATALENAKCPGGCIKLSEGGVLCLTTQKAGTVDNEKAAEDLRPEEKRRLVVCPSVDVVDPKSGEKHASGIRTRWERADAELEKDCVVAATPMITVSVDGLKENDLVEQLAAACAPCPVSAKSWGPCPQCLLDNSCTKACPTSDGGVP